MKVAFLYNHDALHQVRHTAPVALRLSEFDDVDVTILCSSEAQEREVRSLIGASASQVEFVRLEAGKLLELADKVLRNVLPFRRLAVLRHNLALFSRFDAIVVPETTSLMLRDEFGLDGPAFVWIPHGAGDRSVGFREVVRGFDLVLVAGRKIRERMLAMGIVTEQTCQIVGYPKFDTVDPSQPGPRLFDNEHPTVVYNPHFDPRLSSWFDMGESILDWFCGQNQFNLIFAPHVMLFKRRLHASVEHRIVRWRRDLDSRFSRYRHVLIDTGSERSSDMTYTRSADIYLGDASSQIYEWIARPRPAIFANPRGHAWAGNPDFGHWRLGDVVGSIDEMAVALQQAQARFEIYRHEQESAFAQTFSLEDEPSSLRAARAIRQLVDSRVASSQVA